MLNSIPAQSAYAKILAGRLAILADDTDRAFRLLLPLQADNNLPAVARISLHGSLALAYEKQADIARALEQLTQAESYMSDSEEKQQSQGHILDLLTPQSRDDLVEMRGESLDTTIQGWIDLALAAQADDGSQSAINSWRNAYPEHPGLLIAEKHYPKQTVISPPAATDSEALSGKLAIKPKKEKGLKGQIALILPFGVDAFYPAADAIERGFLAAQNASEHSADTRIYASNANKNEIAALYAKAVSEGAKYIIGPLTRDEVTELSTQPIPVPTLALNQAGLTKNPANFYTYGLFIEGEAAQIAKMGRDSGMQTATIVMTETTLANRIAKAFSDAWLADGGQIRLQIIVAQGGSLDEIKAKVLANPADMILMATTAEESRIIRPYLDQATPTFGLSYIYTGINADSADQALSAVRFIDMPWLLNQEDSSFSDYKADAMDLPQGEMQRWYALGADAYRIMSILANQPRQSTTLRGLSGKIQISPDGQISRQLAVGRFSQDGVLLEKLP